MLVLLLSLSLAYNYDYEYELDENGWGKKIRKAVKKVTKPVTKAVKQVTKPVTKVVKQVTKPVTKVVKKAVSSVSKFIHDSSSSQWADPIRIDKVEKITESKDYGTNNPPSMAQEIVNEFGVDSDKLNTFLSRARFAKTTKTLLNSVKFGAKSDMKNRVADLGQAVLKVTNNGGSYTINVRKVSAVAQIFANTIKKSTSKHFGRKRSHQSASWRPLSTTELNGVYNTISQAIQSELQSYKVI